jgi:hypothetical protein
VSHNLGAETLNILGVKNGGVKTVSGPCGHRLSKAASRLEHCAVTKQAFAGLEGVAVTFAVFSSLRGLFHLAVGFPARTKWCYVTPLEQFRTCVCARCCSRTFVGAVRHPHPSTFVGSEVWYLLYFTLLYHVRTIKLKIFCPVLGYVNSFFICKP